MTVTLVGVIAGFCATPRGPQVFAMKTSTCTVMANAVVNEWSRPVAVSTVERRTHRLFVEAKSEECNALAARFDLKSIGALSANVSMALVDNRRTRIRASGTFSARDVQRESSTGDVTTLQVKYIR